MNDNTSPVAHSNGNPRPRSKVVTVISWVMIVHWGLSFLVGAAVLFLIQHFLTEDFLGFAYTDDGLEGPRFWFGRIFGFLIPLLWISLPLAVLFIISALGVLWRAEWGRVASIFLLIVSTLLSLFSNGFAYHALYGFYLSADSISAMPLVQFVVTSGVSVALLTAFHAYVIYKLTRPEIRAEFR